MLLVLYMLWIPILFFLVTLVLIFFSLKNKIKNLFLRSILTLTLGGFITFILLPYLIELQEVYLRNSGFRWQ